MDWLKTLVRLSKKLLIFFYLSLADVSLIVVVLLTLMRSDLSRAVAARVNLLEERVRREMERGLDGYRLNCIYYDIKHA
jgi:hypothetical protein